METRIEPTKSLKDVALKYGGILGAIGIVITLAVYIIDETLMTAWYVGMISLIIGIVLATMAVKEIRSADGGYISFGKAFKASFFTFAIAVVIGVAFSFLLYYVIDPGMKDRASDIALEQGISVLEGLGFTEDQIDEQMDDLIKRSKFSATTLLIQLLGGFFTYAIVALIIAAIMKNKRPEYEV